MKLDKSLFHFPGARSWMWDYCLPLGKFEFSGRKYDLGVYVTPTSVSAAIVYSNTPGDYASGDLECFADGKHEVYDETLRRYKQFIGIPDMSGKKEE